MMVWLLQPSSWIVCLSGCVLHQSLFRYFRSVTCNASWLDSSTSSVDLAFSFPRGLEPGSGGCWVCSESLGWALSGEGMVPCDPRFLLLPSPEGSRRLNKRKTPTAETMQAILRIQKRNIIRLFSTNQKVYPKLQKRFSALEKFRNLIET